jgi:MFS transporter, PCFT/HCP family, solute carrier family 46, member 3
MLIPIVGELLTAIGLILCTYFEHWPMEVAGITEALFPGLAGENLMNPSLRDNRLK